MSCEECGKSFNTGILAGIIVCGLLFMIFNIIQPTQGNLEDKIKIDLDCPDCNLSCPKPNSLDCKCEVSCLSKDKVFEACHIPEKYFSKNKITRTYTGFSNIPAIFQDNELTATKAEEYITGCFYEYNRGNEKVIHRLTGVYDDYLIFKGDNLETFEKVEREDVDYLILEVKFK